MESINPSLQCDLASKKPTPAVISNNSTPVVAEIRPGEIVIGSYTKKTKEVALARFTEGTLDPKEFTKIFPQTEQESSFFILYKKDYSSREVSLTSEAREDSLASKSSTSSLDSLKDTQNDIPLFETFIGKTLAQEKIQDQARSFFESPESVTMIDDAFESITIFPHEMGRIERDLPNDNERIYLP
jgi:hypothetical protein